jgi:DNA-binding IclR family transcriptional regulator
MANHNEVSFIWNGKKQILREGQLLTGLKKLSEKTGIAQATVYRILKYLENEKQIEQQKTTKYTVITIVNWGR